MPRYRSRSYSPRRRRETPPRGEKRYYDDAEEDRYRDSRSYRSRRSPAPSGLLIRNLPLDARPEDLRAPFEKFGQLKDIYLPKNYHTGEPRGFGFVKYRYAENAAEAKECMNHKVIGGREIRIVFAEENRKSPLEMRKTSRTRDHKVKDDYSSPIRSKSVPRSSSPPARRGNSPRQSSPSPRMNGSPRDEREYRSGKSRSARSDSGSPSRSRSQSYGPR